MDKIWLRSYPASVPPTIDPDQYSSLTALIQETCTRYADKPSFENLGTKITYQELWDKSSRFAAYLQKELGLVKGDRFAIMMPNLLQYPIAMIAALRLGLVIVNINPLYTERELVFPLVDSGAKAVVVLANFASILEKVLLHTPELKHIIITELGDEFSTLKRIGINSYLRYIKKLVPVYNIENSKSYREVFEHAEKLTFDPVELESEDLAFLQYTGGTTGRPKGAMLTHRNLVANVLQSLGFIDQLLVAGQEIVISPLPLYHIFSLTICSFCFLFLGGLMVLITNPRDISGFIKEIKKIPFTGIVGVNTLYAALMRHKDFRSLSFDKLKITIAGGMAVTHAVAEEWQALTKRPVIMGYGLTEASPVVTINPIDSEQFTGSIGLPVPSTDVAIRDEQGNNVPLGAPGELCIKGPQVMKGYWRQPEETKAVLSTDGWLRTGDVVTMDEAGFVYIVDRKKDMILVSGFNVYPTEIEDIIASHPGVLEVAVIGEPHAETGEIVKAYIVKRDPALTEQEVIRYCHERLTGYKVPKKIEFRDTLPKSNVGKILKRELREQQEKGNF